MFCIQAKFSNSGVRFMQFEQPNTGNVLVSFRPVNTVDQATQFQTREQASSACSATKAVFAIQKQTIPVLTVVEA